MFSFKAEDGGLRQSARVGGGGGRLRPQGTLMSLQAALRLLLFFCLDGPGRGQPGAQADEAPSAANTLVWGPGLDANVVLPARFFYIQAVDSSGRKWVQRAEMCCLFIKGGSYGCLSEKEVRFSHNRLVNLVLFFYPYTRKRRS